MLQGHHEASTAWEEFIQAKLTKLFNFKPTHHEPALSTTVIDGYKVYLARQVDDFRFACASQKIIKQIIITLQENYVRIKIVDSSRFNGADITEYKEAIKVHATTYINKVKAKIGNQLKTIRLPKQICTDSQLRSMTSDLSVLSDKEMQELDTKYGFKYRTATGMLLFAYVLCRLDIGFLVITLSKYNHQPNEVHFEVAA